MYRKMFPLPPIVFAKQRQRVVFEVLLTSRPPRLQAFVFVAINHFGAHEDVPHGDAAGNGAMLA